MSPPLIVIVMHGAGPYYIEPLVQAGRMPHVARLRAQGSRRRVISPYPVSAAAWVTMFTGRGVGRHGVIDYLEFDARRYHATSGRLVDPAAYRDDTLFEALGRAGRRVASLYLPMTYPPWPVNGIMVSGFPLPDERRPPTWPPELAASMSPLNEQRLATLRYERPQDVERYLDLHLDRIEALTLEILQGRGYDVVLACLAAPDIAHHYFWRRDDPGALERIHRVYEKVDRAIGRFAAEVPDEAHFVLLSDHGGGPAPGRVFHVNRWLAEQGWLALRKSAGPSGPLVPLVNRSVQWAKRLRLNQRLAPLVTGRLRERISSLTHNDAFVDWRRSRAYGMGFFYPLAGIEVNLRGRQAEGIVQPGAEYESLVREIIQVLEALRDPATAQHVCERVCRREELFDGPHLERFPDVIAALDADHDTRTPFAASAFGPNDMQWEYPYMGYHHREGIVVARGPSATAGASFPPAEMADIAPTLLHLAGVPAPPTVEGRVLEL